jgi:transcriptional regulator with XRE-family HTH domain
LHGIAGVRQTELAGRLGEPQSFVSKYEHGERRLTFVEVLRICRALEVNFAEFAQEFEAGQR